MNTQRANSYKRIFGEIETSIVPRLGELATKMGDMEEWNFYNEGTGLIDVLRKGNLRCKTYTKVVLEVQ